MAMGAKSIILPGPVGGRAHSGIAAGARRSRRRRQRMNETPRQIRAVSAPPTLLRLESRAPSGAVSKCALGGSSKGDLVGNKARPGRRKIYSGMSAPRLCGGSHQRAVGEVRGLVQMGNPQAEDGDAADKPVFFERPPHRARAPGAALRVIHRRTLTDHSALACDPRREHLAGHNPTRCL